MRGGSEPSIQDLLLTDKGGASQTGLSVRVASLERVLGSILEDVAQIAVVSETLHRIFWSWGLQPEEWHAARHDIDEIHRKGEGAELAPINPDMVAVRAGSISASITSLVVQVGALYHLLVGADKLISEEEFAAACTAQLQAMQPPAVDPQTEEAAGDASELSAKLAE